MKTIALIHLVTQLSTMNEYMSISSYRQQHTQSDQQWNTKHEKSPKNDKNQLLEKQHSQT